MPGATPFDQLQPADGHMRGSSSSSLTTLSTVCQSAGGPRRGGAGCCTAVDSGPAGEVASSAPSGPHGSYTQAVWPCELRPARPPRLCACCVCTYYLVTWRPRHLPAMAAAEARTVVVLLRGGHVRPDLQRVYKTSCMMASKEGLKVAGLGPVGRRPVGRNYPPSE